MWTTIDLSAGYETSAKIMERVVYTRFYTYLMSKYLLIWRNSGFRSLDGTVNQLVNIVHNVYHDLDTGHDSCIVFLDASKAFDKVWNKGLIIHKLKISVDTNLLGWFKSYLNNRRIRTVVNGEHSTWIPFFVGVPQGSILGPLLFLVYINDIIINVKSSIYNMSYSVIAIYLSTQPLQWTFNHFIVQHITNI